MSTDAARGWRWRNVPVPEAHVGGLLVGGALHLVRPWPLGVDAPLAWPLGGLLLLSGMAVVSWSVLAVGRQAVEAPTALVTDGPYRHSRNPMYTGWTAGYLGIVLLVGVAWPLALLPVVVAAVHRAVRREERSLERRFGEEYRCYRRSVRRYL